MHPRLRNVFCQLTCVEDYEMPESESVEVIGGNGLQSSREASWQPGYAGAGSFSLSCPEHGFLEL